MRRQIADATAAIGVLQPGQSALDRIGEQLTKIRLLALDNTGAAHQSEIGAAIEAVNTILDTTSSENFKPFAPASGATTPDALASFAPKMAAFGSETHREMTALAQTVAAQPGDAKSAVAVIDLALSNVAAFGQDLQAQTAKLQGAAVSQTAYLNEFAFSQSSAVLPAAEAKDNLKALTAGLSPLTLQNKAASAQTQRIVETIDKASQGASARNLLLTKGLDLGKPAPAQAQGLRINEQRS